MHRRVEDQGQSMLAKESLDLTNNPRRKKHSCFARRWRKCINDAVGLLPHYSARDNVNGIDGFGILGSNSRNDARSVNAQRCKRFEVGLNSSPSAAVGASDCKRYWYRFVSLHLCKQSASCDKSTLFSKPFY